MFRMTRLASAMAAASLTAIPAYAQDTTLEPVIVTATRTAQSVDATLASVTVLSREDIQRSGARSIPELLRQTPGITFSSNGGHGQSSSIYIRGSNSDHVLVLLDGIRLGSATAGNVSFEYLPLSQVERIEIVRGPRSSLYGSEALGGVIQIFTKPEGTGMQNSLISYGTHASETIETAWAAHKDNLHAAIRLSHFKTDGINVKSNNSQPDQDGHENNAFDISSGIRLESGAEIDARWFRAVGSSDYDGTPNHTDFVEEVIALTAEQMLTPHWNSRLRMGSSADQQHNLSNAASYSRFNTRRNQASWQNDLELTNGLLSLGVDYLEDRIQSTTSYARDNRDNKAVFLQYQTTLGAHQLELASRHDDNSQFGTHNTGSLAWGTQLHSDLKIHASIGNAFKAPDFNDLYWPVSGNAALLPEKSRSFELGLRGNVDGLSWSATGYRSDYKNLIAWADTGVDNDSDGYTDWQPSNINRARIDGLELTLNQTLYDWDLAAQVNLQNHKDRNTGKRLPKRPMQNARLSLSRKLGLAEFGATLESTGHRFNDTSNSTRVGGYSLLHLQGSYPLAKQWKLELQANNVTNRNYQTSDGYNSLGTEVFIGFRFIP